MVPPAKFSGLSEHERRYCITRKELLGVVFGLKKYRQHLLGRQIVVRTDHAALTHLMRMAEPIGQQGRWLDLLGEFHLTIQHRPGRVHGNSDALSRCPCVRGGNPDCKQCSWPQRAEVVEVSNCRSMEVDPSAPSGDDDGVRSVPKLNSIEVTSASETSPVCTAPLPGLESQIGGVTSSSESSPVCMVASVSNPSSGGVMSSSESSPVESQPTQSVGKARDLDPEPQLSGIGSQQLADREADSTQRSVSAGMVDSQQSSSAGVARAFLMMPNLQLLSSQWSDGNSRQSASERQGLQPCLLQSVRPSASSDARLSGTAGSTELLQSASDGTQSSTPSDKPDGRRTGSGLRQNSHGDVGTPHAGPSPGGRVGVSIKAVSTEVDLEVIRKAQSEDASTSVVLGYLKAGAPREEIDVRHYQEEARQLFNQWESLVVRDEVLYRRFHHVDGSTNFLQVVLPNSNLSINLVIMLCNEKCTRSHFSLRSHL